MLEVGMAEISGTYGLAGICIYYYRMFGFCKNGRGAPTSQKKAYSLYLFLVLGGRFPYAHVFVECWPGSGG